MALGTDVDETNQHEHTIDKNTKSEKSDCESSAILTKGQYF